MPPHRSPGALAFPDSRLVRKRVLADENTAEFARMLGVSTDEYIDHVVHFLRHHQEEPEFYVVEEPDLRAMGLDRPAPEEMGRWRGPPGLCAQPVERPCSPFRHTPANPVPPREGCM